MSKFELTTSLKLTLFGAGHIDCKVMMKSRNSFVMRIL